MALLTQQRSIATDGMLLPFGVYEGIIPDVSTKHWDGKGFLLSHRRTHRKAWFYYGFFSEEFICGIAIADAGMMAVAFSYFYDATANLFIEDKITVPFGLESKFDPGVNSNWKLKNYRLNFSGNEFIYQTTGKFEMKIESEIMGKGISVMAPSKDGRPFNYSYKELMLPSAVSVSYKGKTYSAQGHYGSVDFTKGYPSRRTEWNWLSCIGRLSSGKPIAVNLVDKFNDNIENCIWIGDQKHLVGKTSFLIPRNTNNDWTIYSADGVFSCTMKPVAARTEHINLILMKSEFTQPFGLINGRVKIGNTTEHFTAVGVTEDHKAVW